MGKDDKTLDAVWATLERELPGRFAVFPDIPSARILSPSRFATINVGKPIHGSSFSCLRLDEFTGTRAVHKK